MRVHICFFSILFVTAFSAFGQPPAETCGVGDSLDGSDALPIDVSSGAASNDFTMTGAGCDERGFDNVTCFTPTDACTVNAQCSLAGAVAVQPDALGLQVAVNAVEGSCTTSPTSCLDSDAGTGSGAITNLALSAGTTYCFVCEAGDPGDLSLDIQATSGDCGPLPVELLSFGIE